MSTHYCHISTVERAFNGEDRTVEMLLVGTPEQIAERVSRTIKWALNHGARALTITPMSPFNVQHLGDSP